MAGSDPHWIEHAHFKKGAYGHHSAKQIRKDAKKGGKIGMRARAAENLGKLRQKAQDKLYGGK